MEPTQALKEFWSEHPDGEFFRAKYYSRSEKCQEQLNNAVCYILNATPEELERIIELLDNRQPQA